MNLADDDFFSPIRNITSDSDSSVDFGISNNITSSEITVTFAKTSKEKCVSKHNKTKDSKEINQLESGSSESNFALKPEDEHIYTPLLKRSSAKQRRDIKTQLQDFNQLKIEKEKNSKDNIKNERSSKSLEGHGRKLDYQQCKATANCDTTNSNIKQNNRKKAVSRPTSLSLPRKEDSKGSNTKEFKKEKNIIECSKDISNFGSQVFPKPSEKKLIDSSLEPRGKNFKVSGENSTDSNCRKSLNSSSSTTRSDTSNKKSGLDQNAEDSKPITNEAINSPFQISVEKIVQDLISSECDKIRQNMYIQQMSFYRELNKVKEEMKRQHLTDTERMLAITEQLAQMNFSLKSLP